VKLTTHHHRDPGLGMRGDILAAYIRLYGVYSFKQGGGLSLRVLIVVSTALPS